MAQPAIQQKTDNAPPATAPSTAAAAGADTAAADPLVDPLAKPATKAGDPNDPNAPRGDKGTDIGKQTWEAALGSFLGPKLYGAIAPQLTEAKIGDMAASAWSGAVGALADLVKANPQAGDAEMAAKIAETMKKELPKLAADAMKQDGGKLAKAIGDFVDGNPYLVVLAALAGAAVFVATNQPIPAIKQQIGLGSGKIGFGLKTQGGVLDIAKSIQTAVSEMQLSYAWTGGMVEAGYKQNKDGGHNLSASASVSGTDKYKGKDGKDVEFERYKVAANGGVNLQKDGAFKDWSAGLQGNLALGDRGQTRLGLGANATQAAGGPLGGNVKATADYADNGLSFGASAEQQFGAAGNLGLFGLSGGYKGPNSSLSGNAMFGTDGRYNLGLSAAQNLGNGLSLTQSANASRQKVGNDWQNGGNARLGLEYKKDNLSITGGLGADFQNNKVNPSFQLGATLSF